MNIAIIGSGAAGLSAAYMLHQKYDIRLFEANTRLGGHANTVPIPASLAHPEKGHVSVDTGFIVYNDANYPNFICLLDEIGVATQASDMSFSVSLGKGAYEYLGEAAGLFAQARNVINPAHWAMVWDLVRFYKSAARHIGRDDMARLSLGEMLEQGGYSNAFIYRHILPMAAAIWSTPVADVKNFPAQTFLQFFINHGLFELDTRTRPAWRTITKGSASYVTRLVQGFADKIVLGAKISAIHACEDGHKLEIEGDLTECFSHVIFACHCDEAVNILGDCAPNFLNKIPYQNNTVVLHRDISLLPKRRNAWAAWNYMSDSLMTQERDVQTPVALSYWMNKLQGLSTEEPVIVTLNPSVMPVDDKTHATYTYAHPQFSYTAIMAQKEISQFQGRNGLWYCGAWAGYGFHEDAVSSGMAVATALGCAPSWHKTVEQRSTAFMHCTPM